MSFGKTLKKVLQDRGIRAASLVDENLSAKYLSKLINGTTKCPTWEKALYIIEKLDMTPSEFRAIEVEYDSSKANKKAR